jgi:hypothetical protein
MAQGSQVLRKERARRMFFIIGILVIVVLVSLAHAWFGIG